MKTIELKGKNIGWATVDDEDYDLVSKYKWRKLTNGRQTKVNYAISYKSGRTVYMHRLIMDAKEGQIIDHIDRNGLNNTRENLRFCTRSENCHNTDGWSKTGLGVKGIWFDKIWKRWRAKIVINGKTINLGSSADKDEALLLYKKYVERLGL